jgi:hypothetical protein
MRKYDLPGFLTGGSSQAEYERWLHRKAVAHRKRDRKRGNASCTIEEYKIAIHKAVRESGGLDAYTGERLDWTLISQYDNDESKDGRRQYKQRFALLPTVDHIGDGTGAANFAICAWRTNDAKSDLSSEEFLHLCRRVVAAAETRARRAAASALL